MQAVIDHVAVAVPDVQHAADRWLDDLGGIWISRLGSNAVFTNRQVAYPGGGRLELIQPTEDGGFDRNPIARFLDKFGAGIQHLTLLVPDLDAAIDEVQDAGFDMVDVNRRSDYWHEAFFRPSQVGGLVVQIAWTNPEIRTLHKGTVPAVPNVGPRLLGPTLRHPDLDHARRLWTLLGAEEQEVGPDRLRFTWKKRTLNVEVERGETAGPVGLRFEDTAPLDQDAKFGAAVLPA